MRPGLEKFWLYAEIEKNERVGFDYDDVLADVLEDAVREAARKESEMGLSNYPPGVTGNEPQITGEFAPSELEDMIAVARKKIRGEVEDVVAVLEDHAELNHRDAKLIGEALDVLDDELKVQEDQFAEPEYEPEEGR